MIGLRTESQGCLEEHEILGSRSKMSMSHPRGMLGELTSAGPSDGDHRQVALVHLTVRHAYQPREGGPHLAFALSEKCALRDAQVLSEAYVCIPFALRMDARVRRRVHDLVIERSRTSAEFE